MTRFICTINPKILRRLERILLRGFLCVLGVLAVNAGQHFHREDAKDAKKTLRRLIWVRLGRPVKIRRIPVDPRAIDTHDGPLMDADSADLRGYSVWQDTSGGSHAPRLT